MISPSARFHFILASQSPRRKELVGHLGIPFSILLPSGDEDDGESNPHILAMNLAKRKADEVIGEVKREQKFLAPGKGAIVLSADTVVALNGKLFGKPQDAEHAREMLLELSGKTHEVTTGVSLQCLLESRETSETWQVTSKVTFHSIAAEVLDYYLATGESLDKAGAYGIQGAGLVFIDQVNGSYSNVVGLPIDTVLIHLKKLMTPFCSSNSDWRSLFV